ncbi:alpha/beta fold hydrolase [Halorubrum sp. DTA46]|uniref:alpha/beta fold hydrolase n=1 Tax=Halorubrum sp. DTA46 TaxID=3402162 RepID=UPI003AAD530E
MSSPAAQQGVVLEQNHEHGTYQLYVPGSYSFDSAVVVVVHGTPGETEDVAALAETFINRWTGFADSTGAVIVAPAYDQDNYASDDGYAYGGYRGLYGREVGADEFLHLILEEVETLLAPTSEDRFYLYGHSAGGQFANRYLVRHPERLLGVVLSAPGRYAFPDEEAPWHYGMGSIEHESSWNDDEPLEVDVTPDPEGWVQATGLPVSVIIGDRDRDSQPCRRAHCERFSRPDDIAQSPEYTTVLNQSVPPGRYVVSGKVVLTDTEDADPFPATARCTLFSDGDVVDTYALQMGAAGSGTESIVFPLQGVTTTSSGMTQLSLRCRKGGNDTTRVRVRGNPKLTATQVGTDGFHEESSSGPDDIAQSPEYTTVLNRSVPPGRYVVSGKVVLTDTEDADPFPATVRCTLFGNGSVIDTYALQMGDADSGTESIVVPLQGVTDDTSEIALSLRCRKGGNDTTRVSVRGNPKLTATRVGTDAFHEEGSSGPDDIAQSPEYTTVLNQSVPPGRYVVSGKVVLTDTEDADPFPATVRCTLFSNGDVVDTYALQMGAAGSGTESIVVPLQGVASDTAEMQLSLKCRKGSNDTTRVSVRGNPKLTATRVGTDAFHQDLAADGTTRLEISDKWVNDMLALADAEGRVGRTRLELVPHVGHSSAALTGDAQDVMRNLVAGRVTVPDVVGLSETDAISALQSLGLQGNSVNPVFSDRPPGEVISQRPEAGIWVDDGTLVTVTPSIGEERETAVPDVVGRHWTRARELVLAAGFFPRSQFVDSDRPFESVVGQDPAAGERPEPGETEVRLFLSKGQGDLP